MTADPITAGERLAGEAMRTRLADSTFASRLRQRFQTWEVDHDTFLAQVESVVLIALLATADEPDTDAPETWCPAAAAVLRQQHAQLSAGLTPRSGHRWLRLSDTACEFPQPAALLDEESEPPMPRS